MKKILHTIRQYYLFYFALLASTVALILQLVLAEPTATNWILGITCGIVLIPLAWRMARDLSEGTYGVDILAATAIVTAVLLREYWAAVVVVLMLTGGEALEN
ncbi:MAG TPA: hypothetical protein VLF43_00235 [Candidatus Saccharimonadales bacterium]|nr:hypothetical protein [Candidatus Saccharimonadales bacterium]